MSLPFHSIPFHNDTNTRMDNNHRNQRSLLSSPLPPSPVTPLDLNSTQHLIYKQFRFRSTTDLDSLPTSSSSYYNNHRSLMTKLRMRLGSATTTIIVPFFSYFDFCGSWLALMFDFLWCHFFLSTFVWLWEFYPTCFRSLKIQIKHLSELTLKGTCFCCYWCRKVIKEGWWRISLLATELQQGTSRL